MQEVLIPMAQIETRTPEPTRAIKSEGMASCPTHTGKRETGLVRQGSHLVWREHTMTTHGGTTLPCRTSGIAICHPNAQPLDASVWRDKNGNRPVCPHDDPRFQRRGY